MSQPRIPGDVFLRSDPEDQTIPSSFALQHNLSPQGAESCTLGVQSAGMEEGPKAAAGKDVEGAWTKGQSQTQGNKLPLGVECH